MSTGRIPIPDATAQRLQEWLRAKAEIENLVEVTISALRDALNVPDGWLIRSVEEGFVAPPDAAVEAVEVPSLNGFVEAVGD